VPACSGSIAFVMTLSISGADILSAMYFSFTDYLWYIKVSGKE